MKKYRLQTSQCDYIAEQLDENNYVLRLDEDLTTSIGYIPADIIEESTEWVEVDSYVTNSLHQIFASLNPNL